MPTICCHMKRSRKNLPLAEPKLAASSINHLKLLVAQSSRRNKLSKRIQPIDASGFPGLNSRNKSALNNFRKLRAKRTDIPAFFKIVRNFRTIEVVFLGNDPKRQMDIKSGTFLFNLRHFNRKRILLRWLRSDGYEKDFLLSRHSLCQQNKSTRAVLAALGLASPFLAFPKKRIAPNVAQAGRVSHFQCFLEAALSDSPPQRRPNHRYVPNGDYRDEVAAWQIVQW